MNVIFMGTPDFAVPCLEALCQTDEFKPKLVFTQPDRPAGRGMKLKSPPIKKVSEKYSIPLLQPNSLKDDGCFEACEKIAPDVIVVVAYAQFLSQKYLDLPTHGCVNVHSSLLPKLRGAAPIHRSIVEGFSETGVSTMKLVKKMDAGPIYLTDKTKIEDSDNAKTLHDRLALMGAPLLLQTLKNLKDKNQSETTQDESLVTYAPIIKKEEGHVDWKQGHEEIFNRVRGLYPWPGAFCEFNKKRLKIHRVEISRQWESNQYNEPSLGPGQLQFYQGELVVGTGGQNLIIKELQLEGKKSISGAEFARGHGESESFQLS